MKSNIEKYTKKYLRKNVEMVSTNFNGEMGIVDEIIYPSNDPKAMFDLEVNIKLESGLTVTSYKTEDFKLVK